VGGDEELTKSIIKKEEHIRNTKCMVDTLTNPAEILIGLVQLLVRLRQKNDVRKQGLPVLDH
jgi:hypothetical protein